MLVGLAKTIGFLIIIYYVFSFFSKYIAPIFLKKMVNNVEKKMKEQQQNQYKKEDGKIGETVIDKKPQNSRKSNKNAGEYVDYEDVDE